jgi:hypothetical protein
MSQSAKAIDSCSVPLMPAMLHALQNTIHHLDNAQTMLDSVK